MANKEIFDFIENTSPSETANLLIQEAEGSKPTKRLSIANFPKVRQIPFGAGGLAQAQTNVQRIVLGAPVTMDEVITALRIAPSTTDVIVDINKNDVSIFTTQANRPTITTGNTSATSGTPNITSAVKGDVISWDIDQGDVAATDLSATVITS